MLSVVSVFAQQDGPDVKAEAYCVINRKDGSIVYSKNMDDRYYPASITKIMTALVTLVLILTILLYLTVRLWILSAATALH